MVSNSPDLSSWPCICYLCVMLRKLGGDSGRRWILSLIWMLGLVSKNLFCRAFPLRLDEPRFGLSRDPPQKQLQTRLLIIKQGEKKDSFFHSSCLFQWSFHGKGELCLLTTATAGFIFRKSSGIHKRVHLVICPSSNKGHGCGNVVQFGLTLNIGRHVGDFIRLSVAANLFAKSNPFSNGNMRKKSHYILPVRNSIWRREHTHTFNHPSVFGCIVFPLLILRKISATEVLQWSGHQKIAK